MGGTAGGGVGWGREWRQRVPDSSAAAPIHALPTLSAQVMWGFGAAFHIALRRDDDASEVGA